MNQLVIALVLLPMVVFAGPDFSAIVKAINAGDVEALSSYFDENVELTLLDDDGLYGKAQATQLVKRFLSTNQPKSFKLVHQGTNNSGLYYCIGDMTTASGETFRVCYYLKDIDGKYVIQEFGIEEE